MLINKDGKLGMWGRATIKVLDEFVWNVEEMANAIIGLRKELEDKEEEIEGLKKEIG